MFHVIILEPKYFHISRYGYQAYIIKSSLCHAAAIANVEYLASEIKVRKKRKKEK
jgi:hypothetical protein